MHGSTCFSVPSTALAMTVFVARPGGRCEGRGSRVKGSDRPWEFRWGTEQRRMLRCRVGLRAVAAPLLSTVSHIPVLGEQPGLPWAGLKALESAVKETVGEFSSQGCKW